MKGLAPGGRPTGNLALTVRGWGLGHRKKARRTKPTTEDTTTRRLCFRSMFTPALSLNNTRRVCVSSASPPRHAAHRHLQTFMFPQHHHLNTAHRHHQTFVFPQHVHPGTQPQHHQTSLCFLSITTSTRSASTSPDVYVSAASPPQHAAHRHHQTFVLLQYLRDTISMSFNHLLRCDQKRDTLRHNAVQWSSASRDTQVCRAVSGVDDDDDEEVLYSAYIHIIETCSVRSVCPL